MSEESQDTHWNASEHSTKTVVLSGPDMLLRATGLSDGSVEIWLAADSGESPQVSVTPTRNRSVLRVVAQLQER